MGRCSPNPTPNFCATMPSAARRRHPANWCAGTRTSCTQLPYVRWNRRTPPPRLPRACSWGSRAGRGRWHPALLPKPRSLAGYAAVPHRNRPYSCDWSSASATEIQPKLSATFYFWKAGPAALEPKAGRSKLVGFSRRPRAVWRTASSRSPSHIGSQSGRGKRKAHYFPGGKPGDKRSFSSYCTRRSRPTPEALFRHQLTNGSSRSRVGEF